MKKILIAGTSSGVGKTTISLGIMAALKKRQKAVAPFKVGPDYIDPSFHKFVTDSYSINLDSYLLEEEILQYLFRKNLKHKDIAVIEGVMGLYDGSSCEKNPGSTAHIAKTLKAPVILVIDGKAMSNSAAAMVLGYKMYDQQVEIKGVIVNKVSGDAHYQLIKEAIEKNTGIPCLGYLPAKEGLTLESRHLGLVLPKEVSNLNTKLEEITSLIEKHINLDKLEEIANKDKLIIPQNPASHLKGIAKGINIGIAKDEAFNFYYRDNLTLLEELGAKLIYFSPIHDEKLPRGLDALYFGGGFPEVFAQELEDNIEFRKSLKTLLSQGLPAYAECGGLMYLTNRIVDLDGNHNEMVGFFSTSSHMTKRLQRFGYVHVKTKSSFKIKGHEFHRSKIEDKSSLNYFYDVLHVRKKHSWKCGLHKKNTLAGYPHFHFYSNLNLVKNAIHKIKEIKRGGYNC
ncbi:cobyrinate a,c-diamide synthase [Proteinivorax tanatarense]|uniref:Cobyrinate a,c-diamide synthase n=1 Tax=Proteinivorax tanatarense TaxID=1260629 RepID=A0AAU7VJK6_9FIRM